MKRVVMYLLLTLLVISIALGIAYHKMILEAIGNFPKMYLLWYIIGSINTALVLLFIPKSKLRKKEKSAN